jgi:hypothetical protein
LTIPVSGKKLLCWKEDIFPIHTIAANRALFSLWSVLSPRHDDMPGMIESE